MQYEVEIAGRIRHVNVRRAAGGFVVDVDGRQQVVDAVRLDAHTLSIIICRPSPLEAGSPLGISRPGPLGPGSGAFGPGGPSYHVILAAEGASGQLVAAIGAAPIPVSLNGRRRRGRKEDAARAGGPQRLVAPMPGKIVRVLVKRGDVVKTRQPLVVVEAMKMENELRAPAAGIVAELHVQEGQSIDAGALLAVVMPA